MSEKKYYAIEHTKWGEDWEETEYFFFLTEKERNEYADELRTIYKNHHVFCNISQTQKNSKKTIDIWKISKYNMKCKVNVTYISH